MVTGYAAGHHFKIGVCDCGRRLVDFRGISSTEHVGQKWITHDGSIATANEITTVLSLIEKSDRVSESLFK